MMQILGEDINVISFSSRQRNRGQRSSLLNNYEQNKKTFGTCRDYALLMTSILRYRGIPARARAGFGKYFTKGRYEDHWVCEYWLTDEDRWVMIVILSYFGQLLPRIRTNSYQDISDKNLFLQ